MGRTAWIGAALVAGTLAGSGRVAVAYEATIRVTLEDYASLTESELKDAEAQASRIFGTAGITVEWGTAGASGLRVAIVSAEMTRHLPSSVDALGFAPTDEIGTRGRRAYVFAGKVRDAADRLHLEFGKLLGCAIAHELGHLLLPVHSHTESGIMRGAWDPAHLPVAGSEYLRFVPAQNELLRHRIN